jgi:hypothetical protein
MGFEIYGDDSKHMMFVAINTLGLKLEWEH